VDTENLVGIVYKGGEGSGHHDHQGRPGEVGGSLPSGAAGVAEASKDVARSKYGVRVSRGDILDMSPEEVHAQLRAEYERAQGHGLRIAHQEDSVLSLMLESSRGNTDANKTWGLGISITEEEFVENWTKIIEEAGGDPDPRFVLATIRDINDAVEAGWLEVPDNVIIVIRRHSPSFDNNSQANYSHSIKGGSNPTGKIQIFQNAGEQGDEINAGQGKTYKTLEEWLAQDRKTQPLISEDMWDRATFTSNYLGDGMGAIVLHELGHHWENEMGAEAQTHMRSQELLDWGWRSMEKATPEYEQYWETSKRVAKMISFYATDSPGELAAEAYALSKHPDYETMSEYRRKFVEHMLYGTGEPLPRMKIEQSPAAQWLEEIEAEA